MRNISNTIRNSMLILWITISLNLTGEEAVKAITTYSTFEVQITKTGWNTNNNGKWK